MGFLERLVSISTHRYRWVVLLSVIVTGAGVYAYLNMRVDVFPNLTAPSLTVMTEAPNMAPEQMELMVSTPIERALGGAQGVRRTRSSSGYGYSVVWIDFDWGTSLTRARQVVMERLQTVSSTLPEGVGRPVISPETSVMGEFLTFGLTGEGISPVALRDVAQRVVRRELLQIPGVAQVFLSGGEKGQRHVTLDQQKMKLYGVSAQRVADALRATGKDLSGGYLRAGPQESMVFILGRFQRVSDILNVVVAVKDGMAVTVGKVGQVSLKAAIKRGDGSINGVKGVVITCIKQPGADTLKLTRTISKRLHSLKKRLPKGVTLVPNLFNQAQFIKKAVSNVGVSLRNGAILVILVLLIFMMDFRSAIISITALPLSVLMAVIAMFWAGIELNTMTLGGLTLAIGVLIDDAIIGVENAWRHLRAATGPRSVAEHARIIARATKEVLRSVVFANILIILVFVPVFFIGGMEGRLIRPLGFAYIAANFASLVVSITLTPALAVLMVPKGGLKRKKESVLVAFMQRIYRPLLKRVVAHPVILALLMVAPLLWAGTMVARMPRRFLPPWNEGALNITAITLPGSSLAESDRLGREVELALLSVPEVVSTARKTGRTELDEHSMDVSASEIEVALKMRGRSKRAMLTEIREKLGHIKGVRVQVGQPLSHRIDHMLSGARSSLAIKVIGRDLNQLRLLARRIAALLKGMGGVEDVSVEQVLNLHQHHLTFESHRLALSGLRTDEVARTFSRALVGERVGTLYRGGWPRDIMLRIGTNSTTWEGIYRSLLVWSPIFGHIPLHSVADKRSAMGPNSIPHINGERRILVTANFSGRDTAGIVARIKSRIASNVKIPKGVTLQFGGQFASQQRAATSLFWAILAIVFAIGMLFMYAFRSFVKALLLLLNLPFAAVGGVLALAISGTSLSVASLLGFIALFGVAVRNGIILISHYQHLAKKGGGTMEEVVIQGTLERLPPVIMTALTSILALTPLVVMGSIPGNEIQAPMGVVILGGLLTSTVLSLLLFPAFYLAAARRFGFHR